MRARIIIRVCTAATLLIACVSSNSSPAPSGARDEQVCSTGPAYPDDHSFPVIDSAEAGSLPRCVPRCGAVIGGYHGAHYFDGLPSGSCESDGFACQMAAQQRCACTTAIGPLHGFLCRCIAGTWSCAIYSQGGLACGEPCPILDDGGTGGIDGGIDGRIDGGLE